MTDATRTATPITTVSTTSAGTNTIAEGVVEKVVGIAAREVPGVHDLGKGATRAIGALRTAINQQDRGQGVSVEVGEKQVAADIVIVAEYPVPLQTLSDDVRRAVAEAITTVVGLQATEINVRVDDVFIPSDDADEEPEARVI
jgi:uncharacterized alkaline shock family protein YloU